MASQMGAGKGAQEVRNPQVHFAALAAFQGALQKQDSSHCERPCADFRPETKVGTTQSSHRALAVSTSSNSVLNPAFMTGQQH